MTKINQKEQKKLIMTIGLVIGLVFLVNCTKKVEYELIPSTEKEKDVAMNLFDTESEYLMSASQQNSSRSATDAFPFMSGDNKRIKIKKTEKSIQIIETERDLRFAANSTNDKLVLEIPVEYVQYQCAKDRHGKCTNKEEAAREIPWQSRNTVRIKFEETKSGQLDLLPIMSSQTVGENCYEQVNSVLSKAIIEADAINFQVTRTFKTRLECLSGAGASSLSELLSDATISAVYHYSLVKVGSILSKDFKTISYPQGSKDESTFGFFSTSQTQLDADNNLTDKSVVQIMNHWNPNRKEIVYHLSDEFNKPENKLLKDLTYQTVKSLNLGLAEAQVSFRINLQEPSGKIPGDIRNSMIVLVEDPVAASVIGYGPQTEDPKTGEIVSARTVMFLGTIKKFVKYTYDDIIRAKQAQSKKSAKLALPNINGLSLSSSVALRTEAIKQSGKAFSTSNIERLLKTSTGKEIKQRTLVKNTDLVSSKEKVTQIKNSLKNYTARKNEEFSGQDLKSKIKYLQFAKNCALVAEQGTMSSLSEKLLARFPLNAKPWKDLSSEEKDQAMAIILPEIWVPTLIHELGHNLGLRHNFQGSEDKENFYTEQELATRKVDHAVVSSSVMEYIDDLRALPVLGKYDIAALRFGYNREIELQQQDGSIILTKIPSILQAMGQVTVKPYGYCTDEHTGINAGCKRFDIGTSYTEIVLNTIQSYEDAYAHRNLRDGRANMSLYDDLLYASRINSIFTDLRIMMEVRERIKYQFNLADNAAEWENIEFLKDLKQATLIGGAFLAKVILMPDTTCAVAMTSKPNEVIAVVNLGQLDSSAISCFDVQLNSNYVVVAEAGKSFNSKKDPNSTNSYVDQIDQRGIWLDKVVATRNLMSRRTGIFSLDKYNDNFMNVPELRAGLLEVISGVMTDNIVGKVEFKTKDEIKVEFEISYDLSSSQIVDTPIHPIIAERLEVNKTKPTPFQEVLSNTVAREAIDPTGARPEDNAIASYVSVHKFSSVNDTGLSPDSLTLVIADTKFVASSQNLVAREAITDLPVAHILEQVPQEKLTEILQAKAKDKMAPDKISENEKAVWSLDEKQISNYLNGVIKSTDYYRKLLNFLPAA